jgi:hypothetical protein
VLPPHCLIPVRGVNQASPIVAAFSEGRYPSADTRDREGVGVVNSNAGRASREPRIGRRLTTVGEDVASAEDSL